jgi:hypothetical protein
MIYLEKHFQTDFSRWLKIIFRETGAFELKLTKTDYLSFDAVKEHQEQALFHVKHSILPYKIPDDAYSQKPFDCFCLANQKAFVVIMFNGKSGIFYMIDIDSWLTEKQNSKRRSLTEERAGQIGKRYDLSGTKPFERTALPSPASRLEYIGK